MPLRADYEVSNEGITPNPAIQNSWILHTRMHVGTGGEDHVFWSIAKASNVGAGKGRVFGIL